MDAHENDNYNKEHMKMTSLTRKTIMSNSGLIRLNKFFVKKGGLQLDTCEIEVHVQQ